MSGDAPDRHILRHFHIAASSAVIGKCVSVNSRVTLVKEVLKKRQLHWIGAVKFVDEETENRQGKSARMLILTESDWILGDLFQQSNAIAEI